MNIDFKSKIHNKFLIEVKDINTNEIVQKGYAENIVLNSLINSNKFMGDSGSDFVGLSIQFGRGTGEISPTRTTLFNRIAGKNSEIVEYEMNPITEVSYSTKKIVLLPNEYVGEIITEVGIGGTASSTSIYTHALIRDSEGNLLVLEPKTYLQEITIYSTVYLQVYSELGIDYQGELLYSSLSNATTKTYNAFLNIALMLRPTDLRNDYGASSGMIRVNDLPVGEYQGTGYSSQVGNVLSTKKFILETSMCNGKIKTIAHGSAYNPVLSSSFKLNLETLAENNSLIWSGYNFDKTPVGIGTGIKTVFNLTWDEAWLEKPKKVYVDGVEVASGFTINAGNITFDVAPADQAVITADYWVKYIPKDINHVVHITFSITLSEGSPS